MKIKVNGLWTEYKDEIKLQDIVMQTQQNNPYFVVALNYECILPQDYENVKLKEGDELEVVSPMQGG